MSAAALPPLSAYVHIPWCVRKCPYCDFNSHQVHGALPVAEYLAALAVDLRGERALAQGRSLGSLFFGGGTPSLFPADALAEIVDGLAQAVGFADAAEITLEANPGTAEYDNFSRLRGAGINRLSLGVQSFDDDQLRALGRIHSSAQASEAFALARASGLDNINIDLMHGLPGQGSAQALADLDRAIDLGPEHISWYQLTIEKNTAFYSRPPQLPEEDTLLEIQQLGHQRLLDAGYRNYEVSAYARAGRAARHNLNYWEFGDYLALGAGAHGKISYLHEGRVAAVKRHAKTRAPADYLAAATKQAFAYRAQAIAPAQLPLEFMMNALRLSDGVPLALFEARTGLPAASIAASLASLRGRGLLDTNPQRLVTTALGRRFLDSVLEAFA